MLTQQLDAQVQQLDDALSDKIGKSRGYYAEQVETSSATLRKIGKLKCLRSSSAT